MNAETATTLTRDRRASMTGEFLIVASVLAALVLVNLLTATIYPAAWLDEVMFTDPAANLAAGLGFHTTAWPLHGRDSFFFGYAPLYPALLACWIDLAGFGMAQVRSLNYVLVCVLSLTLWAWSRRAALVQRPAARVTLVLLVSLGYGIAFGYRSGRPDVLMALVCALCLLTMTMSAGRRKDVLVFSIWVLVPLAGIQLVPYGLMMLALGVLFYRRDALRPCATAAAGLVCGVATLFALYWHNDVFASFVAAMTGNTGTGLLSTALGKGRFSHENTIPKDFSLFFVIVAAILLWWNTRHVPAGQPGRRVLSFALVATAVVPVGMVLAGKFPTYYSWMVYLPLAIGAAAAYPLARPSGPARLGIAACLTLACATGLPFQLAYASHDIADRDHQRVLNLIGPLVSATDSVVVDYGAYYAVRPHAASVFAPHSVRSMSADERASVTLMVVDPAQAREFQERIGGAWRAVGDPIIPSRRMLLEDLTGSKASFGAFERKYRLQAYARDAQ